MKYVKPGSLQLVFQIKKNRKNSRFTAIFHNLNLISQTILQFRFAI